MRSPATPRRVPETASATLTVRRMRLDKLRPDSRNPRIHPDPGTPQWEALKRSLVHDYFDPLGINSGKRCSKLKNVLWSGHLRLKVLAEMGVREADVVVKDYTQAEHLARLVAANRQAGEDDSVALANLLKGMDGESLLTAMAEDDIAALLRTLDPEPLIDAEAQIDRAAELQKEWQTKRGQLWELGEHRLLCGDSTNAEDAARIGSAECQTLVFDPEWDDLPQKIAGQFSNTLAFSDCQRIGEMFTLFGAPAWIFVWDCGSCWFTPNRPLKKSKLCAWFGDVSAYNMDGAHYGDAGEARAVFNSRGSYDFKPDARGKHLADVYAETITQVHADNPHSHSKPIDWMRLLIGNCTAGAVFDPFAGSGTTLIACEQLNRRCRAVEIDPGYVAVTLERWQEAGFAKPDCVAN